MSKVKFRKLFIYVVFLAGFTSGIIFTGFVVVLIPVAMLSRTLGFFIGVIVGQMIFWYATYQFSFKKRR